MAVISPQNNQLYGPLHESGFGNLAIKGIDEIALPDGIIFFPQTLGWKLLALILCCYLLCKLYGGWQRWRRNHYRRVALKKVNELTSDNGLAAGAMLSELSVLLKKTALQAYPREQVAGMYGTEWLQFLNQQASYNAFDEVSQGLLTVTVYRPGPEVSGEQCQHLVDQISRWIRKHPDAYLPSKRSHLLAKIRGLVSG